MGLDRLEGLWRLRHNTGKELVLDAVPFAGAWGQMMDLDGDTNLNSQTLKFDFQRRARAPLEPPPSAVMTSRVAKA